MPRQVAIDETTCRALVAWALALTASVAGADERRWSAAVPAAVQPARVTLDCPDDLTVECDGMGNVVEREAWLAAFEAGANGRCQPAELVLDSMGNLTPTLSFPDFSDLSAWTLNGVTATIGNPVDDGTRRVLRLTDGLGQSGSAFVTNPVALAGDASFSAYFTFRIGDAEGVGDGDGAGADGLVFVIQTVSDTAGGTGGGIGYQGIIPSLGVEFDTYDNGAWDRFDGNHVGIDENGDVASIQQASVARRFNDGGAWHAWVDYDGALDVLEVRLASDALRPDLPILSHVVDLPALLGTSDAFVGFTSGTGGGAGDHDVLSFFFTEGLVPFECGGTGRDVVLASATDDCRDTTSCLRTLTLVDTTPPELASDAIPWCHPDAASAEAAALAATSAFDACSPPVVLDVSSSGACDGVVTVAGTDACGNVASVVHDVRIDAAPPIFTTCPATIEATASGPGGATVPVLATASDGCADVVVTNDRTAGGADATDLYPCGLSRVTFTAEDACGLAATCEVLVRVVPDGSAPDVGPVLRVTKDAADRPLLDWTTAPAADWYAVLRGARAAATVAPALGGWGVPGRTWADAGADGALLHYDVRAGRCDGSLTGD